MSGAAAVLALSAAAGPAAALVKGFEPMAALKGKDYGKERQRWVPVPHETASKGTQPGWCDPTPTAW